MCVDVCRFEKYVYRNISLYRCKWMRIYIYGIVQTYLHVYIYTHIYKCAVFIHKQSSCQWTNKKRTIIPAREPLKRWGKHLWTKTPDKDRIAGPLREFHAMVKEGPAREDPTRSLYKSLLKPSRASFHSHEK